MGTGDYEDVWTVTDPHCFKVHLLMCMELKKLVDRITSIFPQIEAARPRCSSGINALCSLTRAIDKANLLLLHCSESSKLYLAITGDAVLSRCQKSRSLLEQSLFQIQNMVPVTLAIEISQILEALRGMIFILKPNDKEAGKIILELLHRGGRDSSSDSTETSEIQSFQLAASRLHITSSKALLIEKRSIKDLLAKVGETKPTKKYILTYFLHLLKKHGNSITGQQTDGSSVSHQGSYVLENSDNGSIDNQPAEVEQRARNSLYELQNDSFDRVVPPEEFKCPISSRLMYDPVITASGQTYERVWIQKWLDEGHNTCPKTDMKLSHLSLIPNVVMKGLISRWCSNHGITISDPSVHSKALQSWETCSTSIASFGSSMNDLNLQIDLSNVSLGSVDASFGSDSSHAKAADGLQLNQTSDHTHKYRSYFPVKKTDSEYLSKLSELHWESQCKVVDDVKNQLKYSDQEFDSLSSANMVEPLITFLRVARDRDDVKAQRDGFHLLSIFVSKSRNGVSYLCEEGYKLLVSFFDSEVTKEALVILETLSGHRYCRPKIKASGALAAIMRFLDSQLQDFQEQALNILCNLSSSHDMCSNIIPSECIPKLVPLLKDKNLAGHCLSIIKNLITFDETKVFFIETNGCIASVSEVLKTGSCEDQEHAVNILLSICCQQDEYCELVIDEGVIPALDDISVNGTVKGKVYALELLRLLRDIRHSDEQEHPGSDVNISHHHQPSERKSSSKASRFFRRKMSIFSQSSKKK